MRRQRQQPIKTEMLSPEKKLWIETMLEVTEKPLAHLVWRDLHPIYETFVYGASISFDPETREVIFDNPWIPASRNLVKFTSRSNHQMNRGVPQLPVLEHGVDYVLTADIASYPANRYYIEVTFFDRTDKILKKLTFRDEDYYLFTVPDHCFTYTIAVLTAGATQYIYRAMDLYRLTPKEELPPYKAHRYKKGVYPEALAFVAPIIEGQTIKK